MCSPPGCQRWPMSWARSHPSVSSSWPTPSGVSSPACSLPPPSRLPQRWRDRRRGGCIGWLGLALLGYVLIRGAAGALTGSEQVFFGISVAASMAVTIGVLASAFTTTPVATYLLPVLLAGRLRPETAADPAYRRISAHVTAAWAIAELSVSGWEAWHLQHAGAVDFVATRGLLGWPVMAAVIFLCAFYARFRIEWLQGPAPRVKVEEYGAGDAHPARRPRRAGTAAIGQPQRPRGVLVRRPGTPFFGLGAAPWCCGGVATVRCRGDAAAAVERLATSSRNSGASLASSSTTSRAGKLETGPSRTPAEA